MSAAQISILLAGATRPGEKVSLRNVTTKGSVR